MNLPCQCATENPFRHDRAWSCDPRMNFTRGRQITNIRVLSNRRIFHTWNCRQECSVLRQFCISAEWVTSHLCTRNAEIRAKLFTESVHFWRYGMTLIEKQYIQTQWKLWWHRRHRIPPVPGKSPLQQIDLLGHRWSDSCERHIHTSQTADILKKLEIKPDADLRMPAVRMHTKTGAIFTTLFLSLQSSLFPHSVWCSHNLWNLIACLWASC